MLWAERSGFKQQTSVYEHNHDGCIKGISWNFEKHYLRTNLRFFVFPNAAIWLQIQSGIPLSFYSYLVIKL